MTKQLKYGKKIKWNFTKFIIAKDGNVVKKLAPKDSPKKQKLYFRIYYN